MNTNTMRWIDAWVGKPACFALTCLRRVTDALRLRRAADRPVQRILFLKPIEQGATVLACDAFRRAQQMVGKENVYICVFEQNREILDILDILPRSNQLTIRTGTFFRLVGDIIALMRRVRRLHIDAIVDLEFFACGSAILSYLCGGTRRVGMHGFLGETPYRGDLMTHRVVYNPYIHAAQVFTLLVETLERDSNETPLPKVPLAERTPFLPRFEPTEALTARVQDLLFAAAEGFHPSPIILFNPDITDTLRVRKWPADRYVELGKRLVHRYPNALLAVTGMPVERDAVQAICDAVGTPNAVNLAGKTQLAELMTLYTLADVLVTNDSGPAHFASLTDLDTIVFFGPETPALFGPLGDRTRIIYRRMACSPCVNPYNQRFSPCNDNVCVHAITVDEVYDLVCDCLGKRDQRRPASQ